MNSKKLMTVFVASLILEAAIVLIYELQILLEGGLCDNANAEFLAGMVMDVVTIAAIPLALRLFKFSAISNYISSHGAEGHYRCALLRMMMLVVPMLVNTLCYYLFVRVSFVYLAIILAISLVFIIPTKKRCDSEL